MSLLTKEECAALELDLVDTKRNNNYETVCLYNHKKKYTFTLFLSLKDNDNSLHVIIWANGATVADFGTAVGSTSFGIIADALAKSGYKPAFNAVRKLALNEIIERV